MTRVRRTVLVAASGRRRRDARLRPVDAVQADSWSRRLAGSKTSHISAIRSPSKRKKNMCSNATVRPLAWSV